MAHIEKGASKGFSITHWHLCAQKVQKLNWKRAVSSYHLVIQVSVIHGPKMNQEIKNKIKKKD
jgi:hypothetical protein